MTEGNSSIQNKEGLDRGTSPFSSTGRIDSTTFIFRKYFTRNDTHTQNDVT